MRHRKAFRKFGRSPSHRKALLMNLAQSLLDHDRIETTVAKAKDLRRVSEKLITLGKIDTLHRRRQAYGYLSDKGVVHKLFAEIGPFFATRPGGYTRIIKTRDRAGDAAPMAIIELVKEPYKAGGADKKERKKKAKGAGVKDAKVAVTTLEPAGIEQEITEVIPETVAEVANETITETKA